MFATAMQNDPINEDEAEIARHEVSEDGVTWRAYDPARDRDKTFLHQRIEFAAPANEC